jgi:tetratricopeptide (TPR) repeat protein
MSSLPARTRQVPRLALAVLGCSLLVAALSQLAGRVTAQDPDADVPAGSVAIGDSTGGVDPLGFTSGGAGGPGGPAAPGGQAGIERIRANAAFWSARAEAHPRDFVSSTRWAAAEIELARATGDVTRYLAAREALDRALAAHPGHLPALGLRGAVLVALHEFDAATAHAREVLTVDPGDPVALATLGDASLASGDMDAARGAYEQLSVVADSAAARVRLGHLAFVDGDPAGAVNAARAALEAAVDEGAEGPALAWYRHQLADTLAATGDLPAAADEWSAALRDDPASALARWGLARVAAVDNRWDEAIAHLDAAIATLPSPEFVARRADLYRLRGADGDATRERRDRETVLAIASLAGDAAGVYDRTLSLYLAGPGGDPGRALLLAKSELEARRDIYGYDALAWALHANGRDEEARDAMTEALALGTRDAKLLFHAGMIAASLGDDTTARTYLQDALGLDPSFDPLDAAAARQTLASIESGGGRP